MNKTIVIAAMMALAMPIFSQDNTVHFKADSMLVKDSENVSELSGNAYLKRGNLELFADTILIFSEETTDEKSKLDKIQAIGNVRAKSGQQDIQSQNMIYDADTEIAVFEGNVVVKQGGNTATGEKAELNVATGVHKIFGPVRGTIEGVFN